jgi:hypothetical protein
MLDDYYEISELTLRQAYIEAIYRADEVNNAYTSENCSCLLI